MKTPVKLFVVCALLVTGTALHAQEEFSISTQIRPRAEYRNGTLFPRDAGDGAVFLSTPGLAFPWNISGAT